MSSPSRPCWWPLRSRRSYAREELRNGDRPLGKLLQHLLIVGDDLPAADCRKGDKESVVGRVIAGYRQIEGGLPQLVGRYELDQILALRDQGLSSLGSELPGSRPLPEHIEELGTQEIRRPDLLRGSQRGNRIVVELGEPEKGVGDHHRVEDHLLPPFSNPSLDLFRRGLGEILPPRLDPAEDIFPGSIPALD